ncbi:flavodoxin domain-containing protein [Candidatus Gottesmanbacteria bacterium]|nr:flavodoxin domain-containing protein [Candidatus Gottesmanbacteria bacterium]
MNILVAYATNSGGTAEAAQIVTDTLTTQSHTVTLKRITDVNPDALSTFDVILFGSPSWDYKDQEGVPHEDFIAFMEKMKGKTMSKPFAIFGLGDRSYPHFCGAVEHLEAFVKTIGGTLVGPSLRIDGFYTKPGNRETVQKWAQQIIR